MLRRIFQPERGHCVPDDGILALNLSFVLHERSTSHSVESAVRAAQAHAHSLTANEPSLAIPATVSDHDASDVTLWLTATIGLPKLLARALDAPPESVIAIDADTPPAQACQFFRASGTLTLPDASARRLGVAGLVLRPGRATSHLEVAGVHDWPDERDAVLRSLERLIQAHAGQWVPPRALWPAPAETLLPSEIY